MRCFQNCSHHLNYLIVYKSLHWKIQGGAFTHRVPLERVKSRSFLLIKSLIFNNFLKFLSSIRTVLLSLNTLDITMETALLNSQIAYLLHRGDLLSLILKHKPLSPLLPTCKPDKNLEHSSFLYSPLSFDQQPFKDCLLDHVII